MKRIAIFSLIVTMIFSFTIGTNRATAQSTKAGLPMTRPEPVGMSSERLARRRTAMQRYVDRGLVPGVVTLVARRGRVVNFDAIGYRDVESKSPMTTDTIVNSGGEQNVYAAATAPGTTVNAGGIQIDWGNAVATTIDGGSQYVYGTAADTVILSGTQYVEAGGATYGTMIGSGGTAHAFVGASVHNVTFAGADATLVLDHASDFSGFLSGWQDGNHLDLSDIQFAAGTTLAYTANAGNSGGKLTVSDGSHTASLALLGQYTAADFALSSDGHGGTMISDPGAGVQQSALELPHAA